MRIPSSAPGIPPLNVSFTTHFSLHLGNNSNDTSRSRSSAEVLGFRPKNVTQDMVRTPFGQSGPLAVPVGNIWNPFFQETQIYTRHMDRFWFN